jgi:hypothetical protein
MISFGVCVSRWYHWFEQRSIYWRCLDRLVSLSFHDMNLKLRSRAGNTHKTYWNHHSNKMMKISVRTTYATVFVFTNGGWKMRWLYRYQRLFGDSPISHDAKNLSDSQIFVETLTDNIIYWQDPGQRRVSTSFHVFSAPDSEPHSSIQTNST